MEFLEKFDPKGIEEQAKIYLNGIDIRGAIRAQDRAQKALFVEGPPTMNGTPHAGHLRGRVIKDLWYRFNTLRGMDIEFNGGWDTQGLPIELQAEKELGVTGGKMQAIKEFGIERIVSECKRIVSENTEKWVKVDGMLGVSLDHSKAYRTLDDGFIEREWKILQSARDLGITREDHSIIAYCPSCQTSLSHAEVGQGYKEVTDHSLYYTVEIEGKADGTGVDESTAAKKSPAHLVVWTTMPFTLVTDAMVGVHPDEEYVYVNISGQKENSDRTLIVGRTRLEEFLSEIGAKEHHTILKTTKGSELDGAGYKHPLRDYIPGLYEMLKEYPAKYHRVVAEEFVDVNTGSGLVHIAPANGEEDNRVASERGVKVFAPIDDEARFTEEAGRYAGMFVRDADRPIIDDLKSRGALVKAGKIRHSYPHCWRSGHALVWLARRGFFYDTAKIGSNVTKAAEDVEYFFDQPRNRFLGIINDRHPWCISRERIWGCPLPVWKCRDCGKSTWLYSKKEIVDNSVYLPDGVDFELHRPWIDNVKVRCGSCGGVNTSREEYVLDTWHNSGSAPWASLDDEQWSSMIPAPFLTEGIDQTRGWAYTLLLESVILKKGPSAPFKSFLFQGHVLDENGQKMSKSKGNVLEGEDMLKEYPADAIRLYFMWKASPIEPLSFSVDEMMSRPHQILSTLYNLHLYYVQNSTYDKFDHTIHTLRWASEQKLLRDPDTWLLSKLQGLVTKVTQENERCRFHEAARALDEYIINVFSQTYVRMTRAEIWNEDDANQDRRLAVYAVLRHVLRKIDIMMHPLCPHTTEYLWQSAVGKKNPVQKRQDSRDTGEKGKDGHDCRHDASSILLGQWPMHDKTMTDTQKESSFDFAVDVISACSAARMAGKLKGRWPLTEAIICTGRGQAARLRPLEGILKEQVNVESITILEVDHMGEGRAALALELEKTKMPIAITAQLDGKSAGPKARQHMPELVKKFKDIPPREMALALADTGSYEVAVADRTSAICLDENDITIGYEATKGFAMSSKQAKGSARTAAAASQAAKGSTQEENANSRSIYDNSHNYNDDTSSDPNDTGIMPINNNTCTVFVSTARSRELVARGLVKDIARRIQSLRKEKGYNPTDVLGRASILGASSEHLEMLTEKRSDLAFLVRVQTVDFEETCAASSYKDIEVDGNKMRISVE